MLKSVLLFSAFLAVATAQAAPQPAAKLRLWDGPAPGAPANPPPELTIMTPDGERVTQVSTPILDVYLPEPGKADGRALIVFGGGGYSRLAPALSGSANAARFLPEGFTVFFLKYRLTPPSTDILRDALADAKRAVRLVRSRAPEWHLDPARIGVVGFSAGSNLTLNLACNADAGDPAATDPIERFSSRPDFIGLCCPWPYKQKIAQFKITDKVPPAFIAHARDDKTAPFSFAEQIAAAWKQAGVPVHFEPYATGGHNAFSLQKADATGKDWADKFVVWINANPALAVAKPVVK